MKTDSPQRVQESGSAYYHEPPSHASSSPPLAREPLGESCYAATGIRSHSLRKSRTCLCRFVCWAKI